MEANLKFVIYLCVLVGGSVAWWREASPITSSTSATPASSVRAAQSGIVGPPGSNFETNGLPPYAKQESPSIPLSKSDTNLPVKTKIEEGAK